MTMMTVTLKQSRIRSVHLRFSQNFTDRREKFSCRRWKFNDSCSSQI